MLLVLILSVILIVLSLIVVILVLSTIKIKLEDFYLSNEDTGKQIIKNYKIGIGLYFFNKIKYLGINLDKEKIEKMRNTKLYNKMANKVILKGKENLKNIMKEKNIKIDKEIIKLIKEADIKVSDFKLNLKIGTEDVILTSFLIAIVSIIISIVLSKSMDKYDEKKFKYLITPIYSNKNMIIIDLNCILYIKLVNIINILFELLGKRSDNSERASNRRIDDYCNEQYSRHGRCKYNYRGTNWNG